MQLIYMYPGFAEVIDGIEPAKLQAALQGRTVKAAQRKGKHMWIDFDSGPSLMLHFGTIGALQLHFAEILYGLRL